MIFITNITIIAQSTFQVCLRNFYKSTIINWKIMRTASKLAQVFHIFKIQSNQILFEFQSFFKYSVVGTDTNHVTEISISCCPHREWHCQFLEEQKKATNVMFLMANDR